MTAAPSSSDLPLAGLKVVEFSHMVMGPSAGVILGDLGAEVVKVEPIGDDPTRRLGGSGAGYFAMYNRNKQSVRIDLKSEGGLDAARRLATWADVLVENFRPGALAALGLGYEALSAANPGLIYCSAKGFLKGPYENRPALDEVAQMMGGLAYMTGPPGRPLRAGASVIDVAGGMFGVIGILAALEQRRRTGAGQAVDCSLFETTAFLVGQHMAQRAVTGEAAAPMPVRVSAWAIYDVFDTAGGGQVFIGVVSDGQWVKFCRAFDLADWAADETLATNAARVAARERLLPRVRALFAAMQQADLLARLEAAGLPFAPVARPDDLAEDPHLRASGGLVGVTVGEGVQADLPALPLRMGGRRFGVVRDAPRAGEHSRAVMGETLGLAPDAVEALFAAGAVA